MKLCQLLPTNQEIEVSGLTDDSRKVEPGFLFASDTQEYINMALAKGANVILTSKKYAAPQDMSCLFISVENMPFTYARAVANFYQLQPKNICAITGTNGKTSIADFIRQILTMMGEKAASMGTLGLIKGNAEPIPSPNTTPNAVAIHQELKELVEEGYDYVAMEASSHGICQGRIAGVKVKVAGFTNLTQDHLDFHKTMENYFEAKKRLFTEILEAEGTAVLNADIEVFENLRQACLAQGKKVISYGYKGDKIRLLEREPRLNGQKLIIEYYGQKQEIDIPLAGEFQAMNVLCAIGIAAEISNRPFEVIKYVSKIKGAKGRLDFAGEKNGAAIFIDYAHTPDALENVIKALRPHTTGKLHVLFGCGGDRDNGKRPIMGKIANDLADVIYVTDDNPRTEDALKIREQIMVACPRGQNIPGRAEAIKIAINNLQPEDILILAGKGHETGQYIMGKIYHFSDHEEVLKNI